MTGTIFGDVGVSLFVAGASFGEVLGDSRCAKCYVLSYRLRLESRG